MSHLYFSFTLVVLQDSVDLDAAAAAAASSAPPPGLCRPPHLQRLPNLSSLSQGGFPHLAHDASVVLSSLPSLLALPQAPGPPALRPVYGGAIRQGRHWLNIPRGCTDAKRLQLTCQ